MAKKKTITVEEPFPGIQEYGVPKEKHLDFKVKLKCKSAKQKEFFNILKDRSKEIVFDTPFYAEVLGYLLASDNSHWLFGI